MPVTLAVKSSDDVVKTRREAAAQRVVAYFGGQLPNRRLLCFLDDEEWQTLKDQYGIANRGFYSPRINTSDQHWQIAPEYVRESVSVEPFFDDFIYLHGSTCSNDVGLTMTFAHELQHFVQHGNTLGLWAANTLIPRLPESVINALGLTWCDVPHEREARIVSKRTAENLFGAEVVKRYINAKVAEFVTEDDAADWKCIRGLATSTPYDLVRETALFFPRLRDYRADLECVLQHLYSDPDFKDLALGKLLAGGG